MAEDREILREIWDGRVPVCFSLAPEEVYTVEKPEPFYLLVPRQSYFPLVTDKVQRHFSKHIDGEQQTDSEFWLECDGQPIKWHYPVGLLFDLYGNEDSLPWALSVHFQDFPAEDVLHCSSKEAVEAHFMSTVKEADSLKHRCQVINSMQKRDHKQLWMGLHNDKFEQFWSINRKLMESSGEEMFKFIPYRLYQQDKLVIQKLFRPNADNGDPHTLEDLLKSALPELFEDEEVSRRSRVLVQGVEAPLNTPVLWMSYHLSYPDNFLHIAVIQRSSGEE